MEMEENINEYMFCFIFCFRRWSTVALRLKNNISWYETARDLIRSKQPPHIGWIHIGSILSPWETHLNPRLFSQATVKTMESECHNIFSRRLVKENSAKGGRPKAEDGRRKSNIIMNDSSRWLSDTGGRSGDWCPFDCLQLFSGLCLLWQEVVVEHWFYLQVVTHYWFLVNM